ncbi:uncharacterized protein [Halyomorpha halys]|uniref:uncharacterized protein n=1 Tax=Halyomorpha halys TaxID=286706 RepID=UPI0006D4F1FA|nr:uncharacterized protein LOC106691277 [Halyomorpha halys]
MQKETHAMGVVTPEEERELKFPVREEQPPSKNFTPVQIVILFIQFCLVGVFLGAIISNDSEEKDVSPSQKIVVVNVEREMKVGGGFKYRLIKGKKGGIEAIILENLPSDEQSATTEDAETDAQATVIRLMTTSDRPLKIATQKLKVTGPPQLSITEDASMPSPPVPPPLSSVTSPGPLQPKVTKRQRTKENHSTRTPFIFKYSGKDFYRG